MAARKIAFGKFNFALDKAVTAWLDRNLPGLLDVYRDIHRHPELSGREKRTSRIVARALRAAGCRVTERVGGYGVIGVFRNGKGPVVFIRGDMDALPIREKTGLPYASLVDGVMHACGHDVHTTALTGIASALIENRSLWSGTLVFCAQPAEEVAGGAKAMVHDARFKRIPRPAACLALHIDATIPVGTLGLTPGWLAANTDSVDVTIRGKGGHGAEPHHAEDPIVAAAQVINALQTIVTRRVNPMETAVITVGSIHAGQKHNIIPDRAELQLTVRTFNPKVRRLVLSEIKAVAASAARAAGCTRPPVVNTAVEHTGALFNHLALADHARNVFSKIVSRRNVVRQPPSAGGEDFSVFIDTLKVPGLMYAVGAVRPLPRRVSSRRRKPLSPLHSATFAPVPEPTLRIAVRSMCALAATLLTGD